LTKNNPSEDFKYSPLHTLKFKIGSDGHFTHYKLADNPIEHPLAATIEIFVG
jgi:hypothetical protein